MMRSPEQQFNFAKRLPIPELAKVLQGQSDVVDMSIAEMVLRQKIQMQKAMQGMQAQQLAQGPSVVEKDLAAAGIGALPVDVPVDMAEGGITNFDDSDPRQEYAGGGIVAFDGGGSIAHGFDGLYIGGNRGPQLPRPSNEEMEARRLRDQIRRTYQTKASWLGGTLFTPSFGGNIAEQRQQFEQERTAAKTILENLDNLDLESLRNITAQLNETKGQPARPATLVASSTGAPVVNEPVMTQGDLRKLEKGQGAPSAPATTPPYIPRSMNLGDITKAPAASSISALLSQAEEALRPKGTKTPTAAEDVAAQKEYLSAAGFDPRFFEKQKQDIEKQKSELKGDKEQAAWLRTLEAGLGILSGDSPYAFVNIGKGASPALKGLQEDIKDIKKLNREYDKAIRDVDVAQQTNNRELGLAALKRAQDRQDKMEDRKVSLAEKMYSVQAQERIAAMPGATERLIRGLGSGDPALLKGARTYSELLGSGSRVDSAILQDYAKNPMKLEMLKKSDPDLYNYIKAQLTALSVPSAVSSPTGTVRD